jgi:hypothetical protein
MASLAVLAGFLTVLGAVQGCSTRAFGAGAAKVTAGSKASGPSPGRDAAVLTPQSGQSFNVLGPSPALEDQAHADDPVTGKPPAWQTLQYASPGFGRLKKGDGYLIDMGQDVTASSVEVDFATGGAATARIYVSDTKSTQPGSSTWPQPGYTAVTQPAQVSGDCTFTITSPRAGRYIIIWFTRLPSGANQESISKVTVKGAPSG